MINDFIQQTKDLIASSNVRLEYPELRPLKRERTNSYMVGNSFVNSFCQPQLKNNFVLLAQTVFSILDSFIDISFPALEGLSFKKKYEGLPNTKDEEKILREIFRLYKPLRNALTHSKGSIQINNGLLNLEYLFHNTQFTLVASELILKSMYSIVFYLVDSWGHMNEYKIGISRKYYDDIISRVTSFSDDLPGGFSTVSGTRLKRIVRYQFENPEYEIDRSNGLIKIQRYTLEAIEIPAYSVDYFILENGGQYKIPDEILSSTGELPLSEISKWAS